MFFGVTIEIAMSLRYIIIIIIVIIIIIIIIIEKRYSISFLVEYVALKNKFLIEMKCFKLIHFFIKWFFNPNEVFNRNDL